MKSPNREGVEMKSWRAELTRRQIEDLKHEVRGANLIIASCMIGVFLLLGLIIYLLIK